ncbi:hypothetical protein ACTFIZ_004422 [Dictyostelium cf. discoideum]
MATLGSGSKIVALLQLVGAKSTILPKSHLEMAHNFIKDCCKFNFNIILSQPKVKYNENDEIEKEYSEKQHISFGRICSEYKMCVSLTIIPSIHLVSDNKQITQSYVLLKPITDPIIH